MDAEQREEVWDRLLAGSSLNGLGLGLRNGRIDLTGLTPPMQSGRRLVRTPLADLTVIDNPLHATGVTWKSLDFTGGRLENLRFTYCSINDCLFDECDCQDLRIWRTVLADSSFRSADLRESSFGPVVDGKRNQFLRVDFAKADLRGTGFIPSAEFVGCTFSHTRLTKVSFQGSTFVDCSFKGELRGVHFYRTDTLDKSLPPNEMVGVDFSSAKLLEVEFRGLDLDQVRFPADEDHIVMNDYPEVLGRLLNMVAGKTDTTSLKITAAAEHWRKWTGPRQKQGVLNQRDLQRWFGEDGMRIVREAIKPNNG
jgi:uncharacterized protein YjbI with pentapeptide repeats